MDIISGIKNRFIESSLNIDDLITTYLMKRLGVTNIETINALSKDGKLTFNKRLDLLLQIKTPTTIEEAKIKIYRELHDKFLNNPYITNYKDCFDLMPSNAHFLQIIYPQKQELSKEEQLELATCCLLLNVEDIIADLTKIHTIRIVDDINENSSNTTKNLFSSIFRRAMF